MDIYIVAWSGGYDETQYAARPDLPAAQELARAWGRDAQEGDTVEVLKVAPDLTMTRV